MMRREKVLLSFLPPARAQATPVKPRVAPQVIVTDLSTSCGQCMTRDVNK